MRKMMVAAIGLMFAGSLAMGASPLKLDMGLSASGVEPGWQKFVDTDNGVTLYDGVKVTISGMSGWRNRTNADLNGVLNEPLWRDFVYSSSSMTVTIEGLKPSSLYELSVGSFDIESKTATPHSADWQVNGVTILSTSFGIPGVTLASLVPSADRNYLMSGLVSSDATGTIVLQATPAADNGGGSYAFVNGLVIAQALWAYDPAPADAATGVATATTLTWQTGPDPNNPAQPNPEIGTHYLYLTSGEPNFINVNPVAIPAGSPAGATGSHGPLSLDYDTTYYWRVDEGVDVDGVISGPEDSATITGKVWSFETLKSVPIIVTPPADTKVPAGQTAQFSVEFSSLSPVEVTWYKDGVAVAPDARVTVSTTLTSSTLSVAPADVADEGVYTCGIVNGGGTTATDPVSLAIARLLAHYPFEQNGDDVVGGADGTAAGGMDYAAGIVEAWAADPNGSNHFEVPAAAAYPRGGYGKGLEEFTYAFWVKRGVYAGNGRIFGTFNDGSHTAVQVNVTGTGTLGCYVRQEGGVARELNTPSSDPLLTEDQWHHVAFTFEGTRIRCFVDGVARYYINADPLTDFADWQYSMALAARNVRGAIGERYPGQLDDLRIYNYAMDVEGIGQLYYDVTGEAPCVYGSPAFDTTGPEGVRDCVVDLYDFADFAADWLTSGLLIPQN